MGKNLEHYRKVAKSVDSIEKTDMNKQNFAITETTETKTKTKLFTIEVAVDDLPKFETAMIKLSSRDNVQYKRKDIYVAMTKYFFDAIENNINKIKVEKL